MRQKQSNEGSEERQEECKVVEQQFDRDFIYCPSAAHDGNEPTVFVFVYGHLFRLNYLLIASSVLHY
ncbi:hypothetical protein T4A_11464 [Trichinella pseudospiralis]|uniref:Uncharacterized protein n=1 Tax=Trichinella pseudospiralis TaxID=6337 RepID=A0A0V1E0A9_TRIPS|nr:hypothetical protein T4A_11464 [Trichinella pseudospiralis]